MARKTASATSVARPPKVVRKPKGEAAAGPAKVAKGAKGAKKQAAAPVVAKPAVVGKRKRRTPTKRELHRRLMYDKRVARAINDEQKRAQDRTASSRRSFKREIKEVLEKIQKEKQTDPDDELVIPNMGTNAVSILHAIAEDEIVGLFNEASFLLEYAKKATLNPEGLEALLSIRRARNKEPTYDPETRPQQPAADPAAAAAAEEGAEEAAAYTDDDSDRGSDDGSAASSE
jgi:hypothetical protein